MKNQIKTLAIDFDGVIHSYKSGWKGPWKIVDPPVNGAIDWLRSLLGCPENEGIGARYIHFKIAIFSSRNRYPFARYFMKKWLMKYGLTSYEIELISFPIMKQSSFLLVDDRALTFNGKFPTINKILDFKPWYK